MIQFDRISFEHFSIETKYKINADGRNWGIFINPNDQFFYTSRNCYFSLSFPNQDEIFVNLVIGTESNNVLGMRDFVKWADLIGKKYIRFGTFSKNKLNVTIYRYLGAEKVKEVPNFYEDEDSYVEYLLDIKNSPRFRKETL